MEQWNIDSANLDLYDENTNIVENLKKSDITDMIISEYNKHKKPNSNVSESFSTQMTNDDQNRIITSIFVYLPEQFRYPKRTLLPHEKKEVYGAVLLRYHENKYFSEDEQSIVILDSFTRCRKLDKKTIECLTFYDHLLHT